LKPDGRQIENQRAYFMEYEQVFVRKRLSRNFGSRTNIQMGIILSRISKLGGMRETESKKRWEGVEH
jgi:hypothetical protein